MRQAYVAMYSPRLRLGNVLDDQKDNRMPETMVEPVLKETRISIMGRFRKVPDAER